MYNYMDVVNITDIYEIVNLGLCLCEGPGEGHVKVGMGKGCHGWKSVRGAGSSGK